MPTQLDTLTPREKQVLIWIHAGYGDRRIAAELRVSYRTITTHCTAILQKLGVLNRTRAAVIYEQDKGQIRIPYDWKLPKSYGKGCV